MSKIILASKSPRRKELLTQIGIEYECIVSDAEEIISETEPDKVVCRLSEEKAMAVAENFDFSAVEDIVIFIGADTVVARNGKILGKPVDEDDAVNMLMELQGNEHQVYTGVCLLVYKEDKLIDRISFAECTRVFMYEAAEEDIRVYVESGEPMDKAGAYGIQGLGAVLVEKIDGDYNNVVGLPIGRINREIKKYL
ncbi:MAG: septum formation inhibitor Maf [Lachnospiraceae bacterium]|nr:septum formation inhibitor Maf [Lachnospiraceae bacterium]MBQ4068224.1 septum formation inhibitor Maf [Lachnospiraceae bacterium]